MENEIKNIFVPTVYVDMDGVIADYARAIIEYGMPGEKLKMVQGVFRGLHPYPGAFAALDEIAKMGFNIHIATKIPDKNDFAATEKLQWINEHIPHMRPHTTITPNKGQLGQPWDYLIDDRIHKANVVEFRGTVLHFGPTGDYPDWESVLNFFRKIRAAA